jgi:hypothetical protein
MSSDMGNSLIKIRQLFLHAGMVSLVKLKITAAASQVDYKLVICTLFGNFPSRPSQLKIDLRVELYAPHSLTLFDG